jgi:signal transduction histidine kinase
MNKFFTILQKESASLKSQLQGVAIFTLLMHIILFFQEYYFNQNYGNLILRLLSIYISFTWIFLDKIPAKYYKCKVSYLYATLIYQIPFLLGYITLQNNNSPLISLYFLVGIIWLLIFCSLNIGIYIITLGVGFAFLLYRKSLPISLYGLGLVSSMILVYVSYYKNNVLEAHKEKISESDIEQIIESKTGLINNIIHEIRNPLHGLLTITGILNANSSIPKSEIIKQIHIIYSTVEHLSKMTDELLDYAKFNAGKMVFNYEKINLIGIIEENVKRSEELYLNLGKKNLKIIFMNNNITEAFILGDGIKIYQLLNNLLINAIKYSDHGNIVLKINKVKLQKSKKYWEIMVIDDGIGIQESDLQNIFDPFVRSSKVENTNVGTGLGLAFCKEIVLGHNGLIWAENNKSALGAIFTIILPVLENEPIDKAYG